MQNDAQFHTKAANYLKEKLASNTLKNFGAWVIVFNVLSLAICLVLLVIMDLVTNKDLSAGIYFMNEDHVERTDGISKLFPQLIKVSTVGRT